MSKTWVWVYGVQGFKAGMLSPRLHPCPLTDVQLKGQPVPLACVCVFVWGYKCNVCHWHTDIF